MAVSNGASPSANPGGPQETPPAAECVSLDPVAQWLDAFYLERRTHRMPGMRPGYLVAARYIIVPGLAWFTWILYAAGQLLPAVGCAVATLLATQLHRVTISDHQGQIVAHLASFDDVRCIGPLIEALEYPEPRTRSAAEAGLIRLLPQLEPEYGMLLTDGQRQIVYLTLQPVEVGERAPLLIAVLQTLSRLGDTQATAAVRTLAGIEPKGDAERSVRDQAAECLARLTLSVAQKNMARTLLRPAAASDEVAAVLLRPAASSVDQPADRLLRPTNGAVEDTT